MRILHILSQIESGKQYILINMSHIRGKKALKKLMSTNGYTYIKSSVKTQVKLFKKVIANV